MDSVLGQMCRACMCTGVQMKDMVEFNLQSQFVRITNIEMDDRPSKFLCSSCEDMLNKCITFRDMCINSDILLKSQAQTVGSESNENDVAKPIVHFTLSDDSLTYNIIPPTDNTDRLTLTCHFDGCLQEFNKRNLLESHILKHHWLNKKLLNFEVRYFCRNKGCVHSYDTGNNKYFKNIKLLKQHIKKVHEYKNYKCDSCDACFARNSDFIRHNCRVDFVCSSCSIIYKTNEALMVHISRKHPDFHEKYKKERKLERLKRNTSETSSAKRFKAEDRFTQTKIKEASKLDSLRYLIDSPTKTSSTQTFEELRSSYVKNDVSLAATCNSSPQSTQTYVSPFSRKRFMDESDFVLECERNSIETQTLLDDMISLKSQTSEDYLTEAVSLSDIQTQTLDRWPMKKNLESAQTQTNLMSDYFNFDMKQTQTCLCSSDNCWCDGLSCQSVSLTSTHTQTLDSIMSVSCQTNYDEGSYG